MFPPVPSSAAKAPPPCLRPSFAIPRIHLVFISYLSRIHLVFKYEMNTR